MKLLRPLAGYTLYDHKTNDYIRRELRITGLLDKIDEYRRNWLSHLQRMPQNRIPLKLYHYRPLVSNILTNFWRQHFDGARLSPNSVRNAVWHALNEPVCQYLRTTNPRCSTAYIDNSLGPLARDSPCIYIYIYKGVWHGYHGRNVQHLLTRS